MDLSPRALGRATLARQLLLRREPRTVPDTVRRIVALQAQSPASPYVALWNRIAGFDPADLDAAFTDGTVVKATLMRITLHAVHADDHRPFRGAMQQTLYAARLGYRYAAAGLTPADAGELLPEFLEFAARPRTSGELEAWLGERLGTHRAAGAWWGLRAYAPLLHAPTGGPWAFGGPRTSYVAAPPGPPLADRAPEPEALRRLILRHLAGFGPATAADIAQFALVHKGPLREALSALGDRIERLKAPDGTLYYDLPGAPRPPADTPAPPRLLPMWDSVLPAHADRGRVIRPEYRRAVARTNGDVLSTLLVDGEVAGVWRPTDGGIEATAFHPLPEEAWQGLAEEARSLLALLATRETRPYSRYARWWAALPSPAEVRVLPG